MRGKEVRNPPAEMLSLETLPTHLKLGLYCATSHHHRQEGEKQIHILWPAMEKQIVLWKSQSKQGIVAI